LIAGTVPGVIIGAIIRIIGAIIRVYFAAGPTLFRVLAAAVLLPLVCRRDITCRRQARSV